MEVGVPKASGGGLFGLFGGGGKLEVDAAMPAVEIKGKGKLPDAKLEGKLDVKVPKVEVKAPKVDVKLPKVEGKVDIKVRTACGPAGRSDGSSISSRSSHELQGLPDLWIGAFSSLKLPSSRLFTGLLACRPPCPDTTLLLLMLLLLLLPGA